jgi:hypothetical protein
MCQSALEANSRDDITTSSMANLTVFTLILVLVQVRLSECLFSFQFENNSELRIEDEVHFMQRMDISSTCGVLSIEQSNIYVCFCFSKNQSWFVFERQNETDKK